MILSNGALVPTSAGLGDITPSYGTTQHFGSSQMPMAGMLSSYSEIYKKQLWVGIVIRKLAMATARNPFDVKMKLTGNEQEPEDGDLAALLERPNELQSGFELWLWTSSTYDIYGEALWWKNRLPSGKVAELWPIHPTNVTVRTNDDGELEYVYLSSGKVMPKRDIVHFKNYNPDTQRRGWSNLEGLRMTLINEDASRRAMSSWWQKGARPSMVLKHEKNLSEPAIERLRRQMESNNSGADNMGKVLLLEEAMEATIVQLDAEEMQYIESRKLNREEVCGAYDVPPPVVHILDKATFSNITEQLRSMYRDTMAPRYELFEAAVDHQLVPDFYPEHNAFTKFNMDEVLRGDFETRATATASLVQNGVLKPSEGRPMFNLPPAGAHADQLFANAALVPLGSNANVPIDTNGNVMPTPLPIPEQRSVHLRQVRPRLSIRSLMGRLGRIKTLDLDGRQKLVDEHVKELARFFADQREAVLEAAASKAGGLFEPTQWDDELTGLLKTLSQGTAQAAGAATATELGSKFNGDAIETWVDDSARDSAKKINRTTRDQLNAAIDDMADDDDLEDTIRGVFDSPVAARSEEISLTRVAIVAGFASLVAGQQSGAATKTWNTQSRNPRSSHAQMDGETVGIEETFSNGMNAPGDPSGGADEVAGCLCGITFNFE